MRGGKRPGAGRPRTNPDALDAKVTLRLTGPELEAVKRLNERHQPESLAATIRRTLNFYLVASGFMEDT